MTETDPVAVAVEAAPDDPIPGYNVLMNGNREVSARHPVQIVARQCPEGFELSATPGMTIPVTEPTTHVSVFTDTGVEVIRSQVRARPGDRVTLEPFRRTYENRPIADD